ncbi:unnamed protein product [Moneuplotes crassus]|uniref:BZIP domain-containing protein n=1 Tax=Euplotes crassus TaxID=5936 RepID=A0AAD1XNR5_EUPCR|nr:unnamed protein product [Moneuplotes crassus]
MSKSLIKPKSNKERSRAHRQRKKKFIEEKLAQVETLEQKVELLTKENEELKQEIKRLKAKGEYAKDNKRDTLKEYEDYLYNKVFKKLQNNPEQVRYTELEQSLSRIHDWSDDRIEVVKKAFRDILDNITSLQTKCHQACNINMPINKFIQKQSSKKRLKKYYSKSSHLEPTQDFYAGIQYSDNVVDFIKRNAKFCNNYMRQIKKIANTLVKQRNKLLNLYQDHRVVMEDSDFNETFSKEDFINAFKIVDKLQNTEFLKPHFLFNIPKKTHSNLKYEDGELTE